jgi:hypothetical protein
LLSLVACGGKEAPAKGGPALAVLPQLTLATKPEGAVGVLEARKPDAKDALVVSGRVAAVVSGYAALTLMDLSLPFCGEKGDDGCKTPWDFCCESRETRTANSLAVEFRDQDGKPIAGQLDDVRLLDAVTVRGKLVRDEHGNPILLAEGWHRDARPTLPADVRWPAK